MNSTLEQTLIRDLKLDPGTFRKRTLSGGDINECWFLGDGSQQYAIKVNHSQRFPAMLEREVQVLDRLRDSSMSLSIPEVVAVYDDQAGESALVLEWIEESHNPNGEQQLGEGLALLHQTHGKMHGLDHDNYIGCLIQKNKQEDSWPKFWGERRLLDMAERAKDLLGSEKMIELEKLVERLDELLPDAQPSLLHGDLWAGNRLYSSKAAWLIDPAVYYGHYEVDLAMTRLFGGFGSEFYRAYHSVTPLTSNWQERNDIYQLYPLLVHVNLFGGSYVSDVARILKQFQ